MHSKKGSEKKLIVNADDLGLGPAVNSGIMRAFKEGIVTSASLMACGSAFDEAVGLAKEHADLGVGVHLVLNEEKPVLPQDRIRSLIDKDKGSFFSLADFLKRYLFGKIDLKHVYIEFEAQIDKIIKSGLQPTHIDSHKHIHLIPWISGMLFELAGKFGITGVRLPRNSVTRLLSPWNLKGSIKASGLSVLANIQRQKIIKYRLNTPDNCYGIIESGCLDEERLTGILKALPDGTSELMCHPGFSDDSLLNRYEWKYNWSKELDALTSPRVKELADSLNIRLIRYDEI